jgi:YfiR/HmsC-like
MLEKKTQVQSDGRVDDHRSRRRALTTAHFIVTSLLLFLSSAGADPMPVPMNLQVEIIKRMFNYDKALAKETNLLVFVVHQDEGAVRPEDIVKAFEFVGLVSVAVRLDALTSQSRMPSAVYLLPGIEGSSVSRYCTDNKVLSISGVPELAESGSVAVSIGEENRRPQIIVNMKRLQDEGHNFSAQLLQLARVVQ